MIAVLHNVRKRSIVSLVLSIIVLLFVVGIVAYQANDDIRHRSITHALAEIKLPSYMKLVSTVWDGDTHHLDQSLPDTVTSTYANPRSDAVAGADLRLAFEKQGYRINDPAYGTMTAPSFTASKANNAVSFEVSIGQSNKFYSGAKPHQVVIVGERL